MRAETGSELEEGCPAGEGREDGWNLCYRHRRMRDRLRSVVGDARQGRQVLRDLARWDRRSRFFVLGWSGLLTRSPRASGCRVSGAGCAGLAKGIIAAPCLVGIETLFTCEALSEVSGTEAA